MSDKSSNSLQLIIGVAITIFATVLALVDLAAGRYGDDEKIAHNQHGKMYAWYQPKSIKQNQEEGQFKLLSALIDGGLIVKGDEKKMKEMLATYEMEIKRYDKEKKEIMLGSHHAGKENWVVEMD